MARNTDADDGNTQSPNELAEAKKAQRAAMKKLKDARAEGVAKAERQAVAAPAGPARRHRRHWIILLSFLVLAVTPVSVIWWYLSARATDQFVSHVGFSVRTEETSSAMELLGGLTTLSSGSSSDPNILYEFIQSQALVELVDRQLDLRGLYSKPENDPYFSFDPTGTIEDLVEYWGRMVRIFFDETSGMIELRVLAFEAEDAQNIAQEIFAQSSVMINDLSAIAREDATRYAREELAQAVEKLKQARQSITAFRSLHQIVDPNADIQGQVGLINNLQNQLAEALIELDLLNETTQPGDPRIGPVELKISVIQARIAEERKKFGQSEGQGGEDFSTLINAYEGLVVDREFAEQAYVSALSAFDTAQAEAQRQSRYLAAYIKPTRAERATYPQRGNIMILASLFIVLAWATFVLLVYAIKDRS